MANSFVLAGGGTAGHVNPLLATAAELAARGHRITVVGSAGGLEEDLVPRAGFELALIDRVPFPRRPDGAAVKFPGAFGRARAQARAVIDAVAADAVVGFGGYVSTPVYSAAKRAKVPIVVHEANAKPGLANRYGARHAASVAITFPGTVLPGRPQVTGLPLRAAIAALARQFADPAVRESLAKDAREARGWPGDAPVLLVTGGSLGAASINDAVATAAPTLVRHGVHVIHLTGLGKSGSADLAKGDLPAALRDAYDIAEYSHDMGEAFAAASAVLCRAGAATVCEVSALGLPALYVPLPHGNGEQALNARAAVEAGAATVINDANLTAEAVVLEAERMVLDRTRATQMRTAAQSIGVLDGAARLADMAEAAAQKVLR